VVGDANEVVLVEENAALVQERYRKLGSEIRVVHQAGVANYP